MEELWSDECLLRLNSSNIFLRNYYFFIEKNSLFINCLFYFIMDLLWSINDTN